MAFDVPPLAIELEPVHLQLDGQDVPAAASARLYDFGAVTIGLRVAISDLTWANFAQSLNAVDTSVAADDAWNRLLRQVRALLGAAFVRPEESNVQEEYLTGVVQAFDRPMTAAALQDSVDLVPLLSGEQRPLSDGARQELLRQRFSYYTDDLVVLTWDRAFVYEPRGDSDVLDVLEVANAQLLEMRYYDELLDDELPRMYDLIAKARRTRNLLTSKRFADLARRLHTLVAEVTELTERVDNALQVTEDVYLARIYAAALELFRVPAVNAAVDRKLAIIRDTYSALYDESSASRTELMEFLILLLIVAEIVIALVRP
jgi:molybdopterin converting factor small subunit